MKRKIRRILSTQLHTEDQQSEKCREQKREPQKKETKCGACRVREDWCYHKKKQQLQSRQWTQLLEDYKVSEE